MSNEEYEQDDQNQDGGGGSGDESYESELGDGSFVVAENKKPISKSTLVMIVIILCAKAGMYFMYKRSTPAAAEAGDARATQVIKQFMSDKDKNFTLMQKMLTETKGVVDQFMNYPNMKQIPLTELQANPFTMAKPSGAPKSNANLENDAERLEREKRRSPRRPTRCVSSRW